jgi:hypothetical protein
MKLQLLDQLVDRGPQPTTHLGKRTLCHGKNGPLMLEVGQSRLIQTCPRKVLIPQLQKSWVRPNIGSFVPLHRSRHAGRLECRLGCPSSPAPASGARLCPAVREGVHRFRPHAEGPRPLGLSWAEIARTKLNEPSTITGVLQISSHRLSRPGSCRRWLRAQNVLI